MSAGAEAPERSWTVRPEQVEDGVGRLVEAAFGGPEVPALLKDMRKDHCWLDLSFVAIDHGSGDVVGHVSYTRGWVDAPDRLVDVLVLSPLSVRPDAQRRGVGRVLVHESLERLSHRTEPVVFLEGDSAYYGPLGFEPADQHGFGRPSERIPSPAFQCRLLRPYDEGVRGRLVYPDVFWRHDSVGLRD